MILPILVALAVAYWLAAPDPVTAGARTASGTGVKAAGAGIRDHWSSGRGSRALTRTKRRDRWSKGGGFWRNLLRLEHGAVIAGKGVKGAAGIARAAGKPVPAAVKAGWVSGRDRHRAKAGNRPVPVALDPPWWRREQAQVQPGEQAQEQAPEQVEEQAEDSPAEQVQASGGQADGTGDLDTEEQIRSRRTPAWNRMHPRPLTEPGRRFWTARDAGDVGPLDQDGRPGDPDPWPFKSVTVPTDTTTEQPTEADMETVYDVVLHSAPDGTTRADIRTATPDGGKRAWEFLDRPTPEEALAAAMQRIHKVHPSETGGPYRIQQSEPWVPPPWPFTREEMVAAIPPAKPLYPPSGTSPTATPTPTEGDPVFTSLDTDLDDLTTVQDFALKVADMAEESDFAQLVEFCKNASDEVRDFGADMAGDVAEFEEVAAKIGDLLSELVDAATKVKERGAELVGG